MPRAFLLLSLLLSLTACSTLPPTALPSMGLPARLSAPTAATDAAETVASGAERMPAPPLFDPAPAPGRQARPAPAPVAPLATGTDAQVQVNFEQLPLTTVIQVVYAEVLKRIVQIDPVVMERRDLVTFRTPVGADPADVQAAMQLLLKSYGIAALDVGGMIRVVPDTAQSGFVPEIRRGSALPESPERLRPVFQLVELQAVRNVEVASLLKTLFGNRVTVSEDAGRNAIVLSGTSENVRAALEALRVLDQPVMRGRASLRVQPTYWSVPELAQTLTQVLSAEGYSMPPANQLPQSGGVRYPIVLLPVPAMNALLVFAINDEVLNHVRDWVSRLDQPSRQGVGRNLFTYTARNTSAESLAKVVNELLSGASATGSTPAPAGAAVAGAAGNAAQARSMVGNRVVVDSNSNTLIINTSPENFSQLLSMLGALDQPSKAALIEVTVAEVRLTDEYQLGIEWLLREAGANGSTTTASTLGGLGLGTGGLTLTRLRSLGDTRLVLNALAGSNRATILSSPRVMARNGETAKIQVGQEVPVITSQQTGVVGGTGTGSNGVLQTVQYRNTGVILTVKPSIFSGDRIDLDVTQEVSAAQSTVTGVTVSPTIATRMVETKLTLQHGSTVMLGGLISDDRTQGNTGIPLLKDIPVLGQLFRTNTRDGARTELIILITPYVISNDGEAAEVTDAFKALLPMLGEQLRPVSPVPPAGGPPVR